ncbi:UDP-N-acetylmuramoyl-tripeptide--D-alanyl-D-alanine ligase [soil metagenome]
MIDLNDLFKIETKGFYKIEGLDKISFEKASIDSRTVGRKDLFIAIKGDNTDGHKYLKSVFDKGVLAAVVDEKWFRKNKKDFKKNSFIITKDTVSALGDLASNYRDKFTIPVICIGGSNGKTTTKDLTASVLSKKFKVHKTVGNFNNHIGLPLVLLSMDESTQICVLEVGANHFKEVEYLCRIAKPTAGLVTNIGKEHLEFFKNLKGVSKAEFELYDYLLKNNGICFYNYDDKYIREFALKNNKRNKSISYSYDFNTKIKGKFIKYNTKFEPVISIRSQNSESVTSVSTFGKHSIYNGLAATAIGLHYGLNSSQIKKGLSSFKQSSSKRMELLKSRKGATILNDTYNSNPDSVKMGIETLAEFKAKGNKYVVLGDMLELGASSKKEHSEIGALVRKNNLRNLFTFGKESYNTFLSAAGIENNMYFEDKKELAMEIAKKVSKNDVIYIKGSRGMKMEEVIPYIK